MGRWMGPRFGCCQGGAQEIGLNEQYILDAEDSPPNCYSFLKSPNLNTSTLVPKLFSEKDEKMNPLPLFEIEQPYSGMRFVKRIPWESPHPMGISYAMFRYLGGEFLWWMLLGGKRRKFLQDGHIASIPPKKTQNTSVEYFLIANCPIVIVHYIYLADCSHS